MDREGKVEGGDRKISKVLFAFRLLFVFLLALGNGSSVPLRSRDGNKTYLDIWRGAVGVSVRALYEEESNSGSWADCVANAGKGEMLRGGCRNESGNVHYLNFFFFFLKKIKVFDQQSKVWYLRGRKFSDEGVLVAQVKNTRGGKVYEASGLPR